MYLVSDISPHQNLATLEPRLSTRLLPNAHSIVWFIQCSLHG